MYFKLFSYDCRSQGSKYQESAFWCLLEHFWAWNGLHMHGAKWMDEIEDQIKLGLC